MCLTSLITGDMQIETRIRYHLMLVIMLSPKRWEAINAGEDVENRKSFCTVGGIVNWYSQYGKYVVSSRN